MRTYLNGSTYSAMGSVKSIGMGRMNQLERSRRARSRDGHLRAYFLCLSNELCAARAGSTDLAARIERFAAQNLRDPNLSSAMIAEAFELSVAYGAGPNEYRISRGRVAL